MDTLTHLTFLDRELPSIGGSVIPIGRHAHRQSQIPNMDAVTKVIAEGNALTRALAVVEDRVDVDEAHRLCSSYLLQHVADTLENCVIDCALRKICGLPNVAYSNPHIDGRTDLGALLFERGARAWMQWAGSDLTDRSGRIVRSNTSPHEPMPSTFDVMALEHWVEAVDNLRTGDIEAGRRYFRRATLLGGEYGTASNPVIQWTYAASFFPTE